MLIFMLSANSHAQDSAASVKRPAIKTIRDIPHRTFREKLLWPHRSFALKITRERPVNYDTAYIRSNYKRLVITLPLSTRFLQFNLIDKKSGNNLVFAPNLEYDLGISISSRWASFILNSGVKIYSGNAKLKGKTKYQDYQLNLYGRKITTDMFMQYYKGFYIKNSESYSSYISDKPYLIREDVYALHMGVSSYYIINHRKFSYGSSFAFVDQQKKSAGSLLIGAYYSYFNANASPSLVADPFRNDFDTLAFIKSGQVHDFGINIGYIYTCVFHKRYSATASIAQGAGGKHVFYNREDNSNYNKLMGGAGKLHLRLGMRYDNGRSFIGAMAIYDRFLFTGQSGSALDYSFGKYTLYCGYRFSILKKEKKILRRLKLTGY